MPNILLISTVALEPDSFICAIAYAQAQGDLRHVITVGSQDSPRPVVPIEALKTCSCDALHTHLALDDVWSGIAEVPGLVTRGEQAARVPVGRVVANAFGGTMLMSAIADMIAVRVAAWHSDLTRIATVYSDDVGWQALEIK